MLNFSRLFIFLSLFSGLAQAHPIDMGLLRLEAGDHDLQATLDLSWEVIFELIDFDARSPAERKLPAIAQTLLGQVLHSAIDRGQESCSWETRDIKSNDSGVQIFARSPCAAASQAIALNFGFLASPKLPPKFQLLITAVGMGPDQTLTLDAAHPAARIEHGGGSSWINLLLLGVQHIGATPSEWRSEKGWELPEGIDHILFIVVLLMVSSRLPDILKTITGFTVGHSISLGLAAFGILQLPSRWVEAAIALTIACVALEALFKKQPRHHWLVAGGFGLIHGFGFASALRELHLQEQDLFGALVGFNIGVELGQLVIVSCVLPLLLLARRSTLTQRFLLPACSASIFGLAVFWFVQRAFALG